MSGKGLIFVGLVALAGYSLTRAQPPVPPGATAADSAAVAQAGIGARFQYGLGAFGSKLVGSSVHAMVSETEQTLVDMRAAIKITKGGDGLRAKAYSKKIVVMDSVALSELRMGRPVSAVRTAMEAKSLVQSVRDNVRGNL